MTIILHQAHGGDVAFKDCVLLNGVPLEGGWVRFKGTSDEGKEVVICTTLPQARGQA